MSALNDVGAPVKCTPTRPAALHTSGNPHPYMSLGNTSHSVPPHLLAANTGFLKDCAAVLRRAVSASDGGLGLGLGLLMMG